MTRRGVGVVVGVLVVVGAAGAAAFLDPSARVEGWVKGEPFFQGRAAAAWRRDLRQPDETGPAAAQSALTAGAGEAVPVCGWLLGHAPEADVRRRAADAIRGMKKEDAAAAGPQLVAALSDADPLVRGVVIRTVGLTAPDVPGVVGKLIELFPDSDAVRALSAYRQGAAEAIPKLTPLLKHADDKVRRQTARTLGKIGPAAQVAVPDLIAAMESDPVPGVREQSAEAFGDIGPTAASAVPHLVKALKDPDTMVRRDAVRSLGQLGAVAKSALPGVKALASDPEEIVKKAAETAARAIDPAGK